MLATLLTLLLLMVPSLESTIYIFYTRPSTYLIKLSWPELYFVLIYNRYNLNLFNNRGTTQQNLIVELSWAINYYAHQTLYLKLNTESTRVVSACQGFEFSSRAYCYAEVVCGWRGGGG